MNVLELDFELAKTRHFLFKTRLRSMLYGAEIDEGPILSRHECSLGKWLYGHALKDYGHIPEMLDLEKVHSEIHEVASALLNLYKGGQIEEARDGYKEIEVIAASLTSILSVVEEKLKTENIRLPKTDFSEELRINHSELLQLNSVLQDLENRIIQQNEESRLARKKWIDTDSKFRDTMMQAPVGITILKGENLVVEMANSYYLQIVDRKEEELIGKPLFDSLIEARETFEPIFQEVLRTCKPYHGNEVKTVIRRFGQSEICYFNFVHQPLLEDDGSCSGIVVVATEVTKQVETKLALQSSESQFRSLVTQSQFAKAIFKGEDFVIGIANESMLKTLWRRELHEVQGRKLLNVFPELEGQKFPLILKKVFTSGKIYKENEAVAYIDGPGGMRKHYLDYQYAPMFDLDGSVSAIMVSVNDVTEKVESRQKISDAADRLSLATEGTQLATWDLNLQTREIIYSSRLAEIFAHKGQQKMTHQEMRQQIHPDDVHQIVEAAFASALQTGIYYYEARIVHADNSIHWVRTQGKVLFDSDHVPLRMLGTMMDITDRKRAELALKTSEGKFRTLADSMPQFVWTSDTNGNLNYFNRSVYDYSGLTPEQIEREGWIQIVHPDDRAENERLWLESIVNGTNFIFEHRFRRSDGEFRWQLSRAIPQKDANGNIQMWVGTSTDIHDSKLFIDQLESQVQLRTKELLVANDELVKTNMELAQFAYVASHDLQEPLRKIQTFATRIVETEEGNLSPKGKDYFKRMQTSSTRMQQLIVDLLAFSRANAIEKNYEETDLNTLLEVVKEQLHEVIQQKNAAIISDQLPVMKVITYQFEQLFTNLIANSLKFTAPTVPPVIRISAGQIPGEAMDIKEADKNLRYQYISFKDNGIGFDPQFKERIFQVFQRLHSKNSYEGTGIGLAICKKIVENHRGFIDAKSETGSGAAFTVYLPME